MRPILLVGLDEQRAKFPPQLIATLAADDQQFHRLAAALQFADQVARVARTIGPLKPPHNPRSEVVTTSRWTSSRPVPANSLGTPALAGQTGRQGPQHALHAGRIGTRLLGRGLGTAQLDAATIFMAEVIFRVDLTLLILSLRSLRLGIACAPA